MGDAELREAAIALDERVARWIERHWMMEYPFQSEWLAMHFALYGHHRKPTLSPCAECRAARLADPQSPTEEGEG